MEVIPSISEVADYLKCNASDLEDKTKLAYWFKTEAGELDPIKLKLFGYGLVTYCNRTRGCDEPLLPVNREVVQLLYTSVENDDSYHHFLTRIKKLVEEEVLVLCNEETEAGDIFFADGKHPLIQKYYAKEYLDGYKHNAMHLLCRPSAVYTIGSNIRIKAVAARFRAYHSALQNAVISMHEYISQLEKVSNEEQITEAKMKMELALKENCDLKAKCEALEKGNKVLKRITFKNQEIKTIAWFRKWTSILFRNAKPNMQMVAIMFHEAGYNANPGTFNFKIAISSDMAAYVANDQRKGWVPVYAIRAVITLPPRDELITSLRVSNLTPSKRGYKFFTSEEHPLIDILARFHAKCMELVPISGYEVGLLHKKLSREIRISLKAIVETLLDENNRDLSNKVQRILDRLEDREDDDGSSDESDE